MWNYDSILDTMVVKMTRLTLTPLRTPESSGKLGNYVWRLRLHIKSTFTNMNLEPYAMYLER